MDQGRTGELAWLDPSADVLGPGRDVVSRMIELAAHMVDLPTSHAEPMQVVRYGQVSLMLAPIIIQV